MKGRGRPRHQMTSRRRQLLAEYAAMAAQGQPIRLAELARRCGLHSYNDARRILTDLVSMGAIKSIGHEARKVA